MVVKSKYNINDVVWFMSDNKIRSSRILGVGMSVGEEHTIIMYSMYDGYERIKEELLFDSKEELLKTL